MHGLSLRDLLFVGNLGFSTVFTAPAMVDRNIGWLHSDLGEVFLELSDRWCHGGGDGA